MIVLTSLVGITSWMASWWSQSWKHLTWTKKRKKDHLVRFCGSSSFFKRLLCQPTSNTTPVRTPTWSAWFNQKIASCGKFLISQMIWNAIQDHFLMPFNKRRGSVCWRGGNSETAVHTYEVNKQVNKQVRGKVLEFFLPASKKSVFAGWRGRSTVGWREQKKPRCPRTWARWIRVYNRTLGSCLCPETDEGRRSLNKKVPSFLLHLPAIFGDTPCSWGKPFKVRWSRPLYFW